MNKRPNKQRRLLQIVVAAISRKLEGCDIHEVIDTDFVYFAFEAALSDEVKLSLPKRMHVCATALYMALGYMMDEIDTIEPYSNAGYTLMTLMEAAADGNPLKKHLLQERAAHASKA